MTTFLYAGMIKKEKPTCGSEAEQEANPMEENRREEERKQIQSHTDQSAADPSGAQSEQEIRRPFEGESMPEQKAEERLDQSGKAEIQKAEAQPIQKKEKKNASSRRKGGNGLKIALILIAAVLVLLAVYRIAVSMMAEEATEEKQLTNVYIDTVEYGSVEVTTPLSGKIEPNEEVSLLPTISGEVVKLNVEVGDYVKKGDVLFKIDPTQLQTAYDQAMASYELARSSLDAAKTSYDRMKMLYEEGVIARADFEAAETQYTNAMLSLQQVEVSVNSAEDALKNATVLAPMNGYVTAVNIVEGALATQASPAVTIADTTKLKINTSVSEYLISKISEGDKVDVYIKALSSEPYEGTITTLMKTPGADALTYPITVTLDKKYSEVMSGMFAEIRIVSDKREDVIVVPSDTVIVKNGKTIIVVLDEDELPVYREVEVGLDNGTEAEILSGLSEGETMVVKGQEYVIEGKAVQIMDPSEADLQEEETDAGSDEEKTEE